MTFRNGPVELDGTLSTPLAKGLHPALILTGGDAASPVSPTDEGLILELEREVFVTLCGTAGTQDRIAYMLKNVKPLIN